LTVRCGRPENAASEEFAAAAVINIFRLVNLGSNWEPGPTITVGTVKTSVFVDRGSVGWGRVAGGVIREFSLPRRS
jgi:hypothetical protein